MECLTVRKGHDEGGTERKANHEILRHIKAFQGYNMPAQTNRPNTPEAKLAVVFV